MLSLESGDYPYTFELNGIPCRATLPADVFAPDELTDYHHMVNGRLDYKLVPSELDAAEPGTHVLSVLLPQQSYGQDCWSDLNIRVRETIYGKVVDAESFHGLSLSIGPKDGRSLLNLLGFEIDRLGEPQGIPTPKTLQAAARQWDIAIRLFPGEGQLAARTYLQTFADREYPVATGDQYFYLHDSGNDHLTSEFLGGPILSDQLGKVASLGLQQDVPDEHARVASGIDYYTMQLRGAALVTREPSDFVPSATPYNAISRLYETGKNIGILPLYTQAILERAQNTAKKWLAR